MMYFKLYAMMLEFLVQQKNILPFLVAMHMVQEQRGVIFTLLCI